jgi:hypothetical protein
MPRSLRRCLTRGEIALARSVFGDAIDYAPVRLLRRRWFPFQRKDVVMAPMGHIHFHPGGPYWTEDFAAAPARRQGLLIHELTHVWQSQTRGRWYLVLMRHPFCRYRYGFDPCRRFEDYGLEQQAEIVRHVFLLRRNEYVEGAPPLRALEAILPFRPA